MLVESATAKPRTVRAELFFSLIFWKLTLNLNQIPLMFNSVEPSSFWFLLEMVHMKDLMFHIVFSFS